MVPGTDAPSIARAGPNMLLVAQIQPVAKGQPVPAVYDPATGRLRVAPAALVDAGHSPELWVIPAGGQPYSLGILHSRQTTSVAIRTADRVRFAAGATLAVTIEPVGGSPSGKPTGAVIAQGSLTLV
jgi:anti-sigma-K factor RskA